MPNNRIVSAPTSSTAFFDDGPPRVLRSRTPDDRNHPVVSGRTNSREITHDLDAFLAVRHPLAVRSSSLLEDSQGQPFAGIYVTHMLPNSHPDLAVRLDQLGDAIKRVYASTFHQAKSCCPSTPPGSRSRRRRWR
ncbi:MAG: hypothetical protein IPG61_15840 [bacterium]|nr:hypothetical protein [bacterium]